VDTSEEVSVSAPLVEFLGCSLACENCFCFFRAVQVLQAEAQAKPGQMQIKPNKCKCRTSESCRKNADQADKIIYYKL